MQTNPLTYHGKYILNWLIEVQILQKTGALFPYNLKRWSERIKSQIYKDINILKKKKKILFTDYTTKLFKNQFVLCIYVVFFFPPTSFFLP